MKSIRVKLKGKYGEAVNSEGETIYLIMVLEDDLKERLQHPRHERGYVNSESDFIHELLEEKKE